MLILENGSRFHLSEVIFFKIMYMSVSNGVRWVVGVDMYMCMLVPLRPEEGAKSYGAVVTSCCAAPSLDAGNKSQSSAIAASSANECGIPAALEVIF